MLDLQVVSFGGDPLISNSITRCNYDLLCYLLPCFPYVKITGLQLLGGDPLISNSITRCNYDLLCYLLPCFPYVKITGLQLSQTGCSLEAKLYDTLQFQVSTMCNKLL